MNLRSEVMMSAIAALETAVNNYLQLDPASLEQFAGMSDKVIAIELRNTGLTLYILPQQRGVSIMSRYAGEADTTLSGTPLALAEMSLASDATRVMFSGDVTISGDIELGQRFKRLLDGIDIDWEEHLSHICGDIAAHKLADLGRNLHQWGQQALSRLGLDAAEYLQQEDPALPDNGEVRSFLADVDTLRNDVERIQARIERLQTRNPAAT